MSPISVYSLRTSGASHAEGAARRDADRARPRALERRLLTVPFDGAVRRRRRHPPRRPPSRRQRPPPPMRATAAPPRRRLEAVGASRAGGCQGRQRRRRRRRRRRQSRRPCREEDLPRGDGGAMDRAPHARSPVVASFTGVDITDGAGVASAAAGSEVEGWRRSRRPPPPLCLDGAAVVLGRAARLSSSALERRQGRWSGRQGGGAVVEGGGPPLAGFGSYEVERSQAATSARGRPRAASAASQAERGG